MKKKKNPFYGVWKLISMEIRLTSGKKVYPMGKSVSGSLIYGSEHVSAHIMKNRRTRFKSQDQFNGSDEEVRTALEGYVAYYGTYSYDENNSLVDHKVLGSVFPNDVNKNLIRKYKFSENQLILETLPQNARGEKIIGIFTWERVE